MWRSVEERQLKRSFGRDSSGPNGKSTGVDHDHIKPGFTLETSSMFGAKRRHRALKSISPGDSGLELCLVHKFGSFPETVPLGAIGALILKSP